METHKATINRTDQRTNLVLSIGEELLEITLTEDRPNDVKSVFNRLISELKKGDFKFELVDDSSDLYHNICSEYITQLNAELESVYHELSDYDLLKDENNDEQE